MSSHTLQYGLRARQFDSTDFQDASIKRILKKLSDIERAALPEEDLKEVSGRERGPRGGFTELENWWNQRLSC